MKKSKTKKKLIKKILKQIKSNKALGYSGIDVYCDENFLKRLPKKLKNEPTRKNKHD